MKAVISDERIEQLIFLIRGQKVMLDADIARIYGVTTARLNQQVNRNLDRFPADFMFRLTKREFSHLMLQIATSSSAYGGRRKLPYVFTEHGTIMLASVLSSPIAVRASLLVVRAFVRLREILATNKELARKLSELDRRVSGHDEDIRRLVAAIRELMKPESSGGRKIGFREQGIRERGNREQR